MRTAIAYVVRQLSELLDGIGRIRATFSAMRALVAYATTHGHTGKIAGRIGAVLEDSGLEVTVHDARKGSVPSLAGFGLVVAGASIHGGHHQAALVDWARSEADALNQRPSAFFSVCLAVADDTDESRAAASGYLASFEEETGWSPRLKTTCAGALQYLEYDFWTRLLIRTMMKRGGHPTDASRDYDYTDWDAVEAFARECAALRSPRS
jgi:menaquinone-dependent protoporphyrinogen oxidase